MIHDAFADRVGALAAISEDQDHGLPISLNPRDPAVLVERRRGHDPPAAIGGGEDLTLLARARGDRAVMLSHRSVLAAVQAIGGSAQPPVARPRPRAAGAADVPPGRLGGGLPPDGPGRRRHRGAGGRVRRRQVGVGVHGGSAQGGDAAAAGRRATESALEAAHTHRVTLVPGAPGFYHHLVSVGGAERALSSVRLLTSGTAPLEPDDFALVHTLMGQPVWEGYGLSESASVVTSALASPRPHHGSVGRPLSRPRATRDRAGRA